MSLRMPQYYASRPKLYTWLLIRRDTRDSVSGAYLLDPDLD